MLFYTCPTRGPYLVPNAFTFTDVTNGALSTQYVSNTITLSGMTPGADSPATVTGAEYQQNGGAWTPAGSFFARNGDTIALRVTASSTYFIPVNGVLTVGGRSDTFTVTTLATLQVLTLSANTIVENSAPGTVVGTLQNTTLGSALSLSVSAGSRFAISGNNIVAGITGTDADNATTHSITVVETLAGAVGNPKSTSFTINVANVFEQPDLGPLVFSANSFVTGSATSGTIIGATSGSTLTTTGIPSGLTINSGARTWAWDGTGSVSSGSFTLTETLADSSNSPRQSTINFTIVAGAALQALTLSASSIAETSPAGTLVGAVQNTTAGSALSLSNTAGGRFALSGSNIVAGATATDYESATTHNITIVETLAGAIGNPKSTTVAITVTNVFEQPTLGTLTFSRTTFTTGVTSTGTIDGATVGSTITATGLPTGLTINGPARTLAWDGTGTASVGFITLTETLSDSANSPHNSSVSYTISAGSTLSTPVLSIASAAGAVPLTLHGAFDSTIFAGMSVRLQISTVSNAFTSNLDDITQQIQGDDWAKGSVTMNGMLNPTSSQTYWARCRIETAPGDAASNVISGWSNIVTDTIASATVLLTSTTSVNKSQYVNVVTPFLQCTGNAGVGALCAVRATLATTGKRHFEATFNAWGTGGNVYCGIADSGAVTSFSTFNGTAPGGGSSIPGLTVRLNRASASTLDVFANGSFLATYSHGGTWVNGDAVIFEFDTTANTVAVYDYVLATTTSTLKTTVTLAGAYIPANWYGFLGAAQPGDQMTANFGGTSLLRSLSGGYSTYQ